MTTNHFLTHALNFLPHLENYEYLVLVDKAQLQFLVHECLLCLLGLNPRHLRYRYQCPLC